MSSRGKWAAFAALVVVAAVLAVFALQNDSSNTVAPTADPSSSTIVEFDPRPSSDRPVTVSPGQRVLFYGDSLTVGSFATTDANTFRGRVVAATRMVPTTTAQKGIRTGAFTTQNPKAPAGITLAVVELGTNDVGNTDPELFGGSYGRLLKSIVAASPGVQIMCLGPWRAADASTLYERQIRDRCAEQNGRFVSLSLLYQDEANRGPAGVAVPGGPSDNFHPNDKGHAAIARAITNRVEESESAQ